jgi:hypothetical protein
MGDNFDITQAHGQHGLSAVQGLNLALFIDTGDLEAAGAMRLYGKGLKQPMHGGFRNAASFGGLPHAPVRARGGVTRQGALQQSCNLVVFDTAGTPGAQFIVESGQAMLQETLPPLTDGRLAEVQTLGNLRVALPLPRPQHQLGSGD